MSTVRAMGALAAGAAWQVTRADRLAVTLIRQAGSADEDTATIARMMLTRGGRRAVEPVRTAVAAGQVELVDVLVSIEDPSARSALVGLAREDDPQVAAAAVEGLRLRDRAS